MVASNTIFKMDICHYNAQNDYVVVVVVTMYCSKYSQ